MHATRVRFMAGAALLLAPYAVMTAWLAVHEGLLATAGYAMAVAVGLLLLAGIGRTARNFYFIHGLVFVLALVFAAYTVIAGELPSYPIAFVLETSSWEELRGFFGTWQQRRILLAILSIMAAYAGIGFSLPKNFQLIAHGKRSRRIIFGAVAAFVAAAALCSGKFIAGAAASPLIGTALFISGPLSSANAAVNGPYLRKRPYGARRNAAREVHILIVGESSRRNSWSAYGYHRRTTPFMDGLKDQAVFLQNVVSDANATVYAVPMLLTGIDPERFSFTSMTGNLVDLAREAGYFSIWLVNQDAGISHLIGMSADTTSYTIAVAKPSYVVYPPDGLLLPNLAQQLASGGSSLFVGMHLFGSHSPYANRYPRSFGKFGGPADAQDESATELVDSYDNSILYMDWFLEQVIMQARRLDVPVTVTYVSDHGEDLAALDGRAGHGLGDYSAGAFNIPAFVWMNPAYRQAHPEKVLALTGNARKEIRSHDFFYAMADVMGINWPGMVPQRSFASPDFVPDTEDRFIAGGHLVAGQR